MPDASLGAEVVPRLALASNNPGKIAEFRSLLGAECDIMSMQDFGLDSPPETGATFEENATLKARFLHERVGGVVLADDSGLEVDALGGDPGVRSARYAGGEHDDAANRQLLIKRLTSVPPAERTARFVAVVAIIDVHGALSLTRATCEGSITLQERGSHGFGYDSLFQLPNGKTLAEIDASTKNSLSHRGKAVQKAMPLLRQALGMAGLEEQR